MSYVLKEQKHSAFSAFRTVTMIVSYFSCACVCYVAILQDDEV